MSSGNLPSTPVEGARKALVEMSLNEPQPPAPLGGKACATPLPLAATGALVSSDGQVGTPEFNKCAAAVTVAKAAAEAALIKLREKHSEPECKKREAAEKLHREALMAYLEATSSLLKATVEAMRERGFSSEHVSGMEKRSLEFAAIIKRGGAAPPAQLM